jgi:hypothetical protein
VEFVVDNVALREDFLRVLRFSPDSIIPPEPHTHVSSGDKQYDDDQIKVDGVIGETFSRVLWEMHAKFYWKHLKGRQHLEGDPAIDGKIILKMIVGKNVEWYHLAHHKDQRRGLVHSIINLFS